MRKNTLFVSVLLGIGALGTVYSLMDGAKEAQYEARNTENVAQGEYNDEFLRVMRANVNSGEVEASDYLKAVNEARAFRGKTSTLGLNWEFQGPENIGGRARAIVVDKDDDQKLYSGGAAGGLYISRNAGGTWEYMSSNWENIQVSTIAQDGDGRVYAGTGFWSDATAATNSGQAFPGGGIWVSDDRGETWSRLQSTIPVPYTPSEQWAYVNRVAVSKVKNSAGNYTVYAATRKGLLVSADNGATWTQPMTIPNCVNPLPGTVQDVITLSSGRVLVSYNGELYVSDDGETVCSYTKISDGIGGSSRMSLTACGNDENVIYAFQSFSGNPSTFTILKSNDAGDTWAENSPAPPSSAIDSTFDLLGVNPVDYNQAITVDPTDCDRVYVGAVSLYRIDGSWGSVSSLSSAAGQFYVHADVHYFTFDPHNPSTMYVATDGGVGKTQNADDAGFVAWTTNNRNMGTTQYYGMAFSKDGHIFGGTQDNGSHYINPTGGGAYAKDGIEVFGGDGYDAEVSNIGDVAFVSSQYGAVGRTIYTSADRASSIHPADRGNSPFFTVIRFWESENDPTSKDSIVYTNNTLLRDMGAGDGNKLLFTGTLVPEQPQTVPQPSAKIVPGTVLMTFTANSDDVTDALTPGILRAGTDSVGWIDYTTGDYSVRFVNAPPAGVNAEANYDVRYNAGDDITLVSKNQLIQFQHTLTANLEPGDSVLVQDPIQSLLALSMNSSVRVTRDALIPGSSPQWYDISLSTPTSMEWSNDGNHLYVGHYSGAVTRISGFNNWYSDQDDAQLTKTNIYGGNGGVSGVCLHPTDQEKLLVTIGGYGSGTHVVELTNAQSATGAGNSGVRVIQGDLPDFPVYDAEYNVNNTAQVLVGTELGLWATNDVDAANVVWTNESGALGNTPVFDVRQQRLDYIEAANHGVFYLGTFGRGIWSSTDLVSVNDNDGNWGFADNKAINTLEIYPNPVINTANVKVEVSQDAKAEITVYTITGKVVSTEVTAFTKGETVHQIDVSSLSNGAYFATVKVGTEVKKAKFVVVK